MAAQGPQVTLGGATRGDIIEVKGLEKGRDGLGHGRVVGLPLLGRLSKGRLEQALILVALLKRLMPHFRLTA